MVLTGETGPIDRGRQVLLLKLAVWILALLPGARLAQRTVQGDLGPNPVEELLWVTGQWALVLLLAALAVTPIRIVTRFNPLAQVRRLVGLFAFAYVSAHFLVYLTIDQGLFFWDREWVFDWSVTEFIWEDIAERPFITVGFAAWLLLLLLAFTSTRGWIRRLGKRWQMLHRLVYVAGALGVIHYYWKVKADTRLPLLAAAVLVTLMLIRIPEWKRRRARKTQKGPSKASSEALTPAGTAAEPPAS